MEYYPSKATTKNLQLEFGVFSNFETIQKSELSSEIGGTHP